MQNQQLPHLSDAHIERRKLFQLLRYQNPSQTRNLVVNAPAGYGKTIFTSQYVARAPGDFIWYDMDERDQDPVFFIDRFNRLAGRIFPPYREEALAKTIGAGNLTPETLPKASTLMADQLCNALEGRLHVVLDDFHLADPSPFLKNFIRMLALKLPKSVNFILITRRWPGAPELKQALKPIWISSDMLCMDYEEIDGLFKERLDLFLSMDKITQVLDRTEGWPMGVLAEGLSRQQGKTSVLPSTATGAHPFHRDILNYYFESELLDQFSSDFQTHLLCLSLADTISPEIALLLTRDPNTHEGLCRMADEDLFTKRHIHQPNHIRFHHLLQEFLKQMAHEKLDPARLARLKNRLADHHVQYGEYESALSLYIETRNYEALHQTLACTGMDMFSQNRIISLQRHLETLPREVVDTLPWTGFITALIRLDTHPEQALPMMASALEGFIATEDTLGQIQVRIFLLLYHSTTELDLPRGKTHYTELKALYEAHGEELPQPLKLHTLSALSHGAWRTTDNYLDALAYSDLCMTLIAATPNANATLKAMIYLNQGFLSLFCCDYQGARHVMEILYPLQGDPRVTLHSRMLIFLFMVNLVEEEGDFATYTFFRNKIQALLPDDLTRNSQMMPLITLLDADMHIALGQFKQGHHRIRQSMENPPFIVTPHTRGFMAHFRSFFTGHARQVQQTLAWVKTGFREQEKSGGQTYRGLSLVITGAGLGFCGEYERAISHLDEAVTITRDFQETYIQSAALLHRSYFKHLQKEEALADLRAGLALMAENTYTHVTVLSPRVLAPLLELAAAKGMEPALVKTLARDRLGMAVTAKGSLVPLLEIRLLGRIRFHINGEEVLDFSDMTAKHQSLWMILLSSPDFRVAVEKIQTCFWPESDPAKGRSSFDSMMGRFRTKTGRALKPAAIGDYLVLKNGILQLSHVRVDVAEFFRHAEIGNRWFDRGRFWQAALAYRRALDLYQGPFMPGIGLDETAGALNPYRILPLVETCIINWIHIMEKNGFCHSEDLDRCRRINQWGELSPLAVDALSRLMALPPETGDAFT